MFRHHKYCVIEVSGLLVVVDGHGGTLDMYLIDSTSNASDHNNKIKITDAGLIEFIRRMSPRSGDSGARHHMRITGTVEKDGSGVHLSYASQAFIYMESHGHEGHGQQNHGKEGLLKYEPPS